MTLGRAPQQADLWRSTAGFCEGRAPFTAGVALALRIAIVSGELGQAL
jgi:hypothetical protein